MAGPSVIDDVRSVTMRVYKHHMREAIKRESRGFIKEFREKDLR